MTIPAKPDPREFAADEQDLPFWEGAARHVLLIQRCKGCGRVYWPASNCVACARSEMAWIEASGRATIHTFTVIHRPFLPSWADDVPYNVAVVELEEGPLMFTNVECPNEQLEVDMPVEVTFRDMPGGGTLPQVRPTTDSRMTSS